MSGTALWKTCEAQICRDFRYSINGRNTMLAFSAGGRER